jgi:hypothetical protein
MLHKTALMLLALCKHQSKIHSAVCNKAQCFVTRNIYLPIG